MKIDWILVADRTRASIRGVLPNDAGTFHELKCLEHAAGRLSAGQQDSDRPGHLQLAGGARTAVEPHDDVELVEARRFAKQIAEYLEREHEHGRFDRLLVAAPPKFLGVLRSTWSDRFRRSIAVEVNADLLNLPQKELQAQLANLASSAVTV